MKKLTPFLEGNASLLKRLLPLLLFFAPVLTGNLTTPAEAKAQEITVDECGVSDAEVVKYMGEQGYSVYRLDPELGTCNKIATTQNPYKTRVYICNGEIVGWEDIQ